MIALVFLFLIGITGALASTDDIEGGLEANLSASGENVTALQISSDTDFSDVEQSQDNETPDESLQVEEDLSAGLDKGENQTAGIEKVLLCAWSQDLTDDLEDGDPEHLTAGSQFLPTCDSESTKTVNFWAVLKNTIYTRNVEEVFARLSYDDENNMDVSLNPVDPVNVSSEVFEEAFDAGLLQFEDEFADEAIIRALDDSSAALWFGEGELGSGQIAGIYNVTIMTFMGDDPEFAGPAVNFTYIPVVCGEFDFSGIDYGDLTVDELSWVTGDEDFSTDNLPTVRNTGNVPLQLVIQQDSMGLGKSEDENWNVQYGARLGSEEETCIYYPDEPVTIPGVLEPCSEKALSLSILVSGGYTGTECAGKLNIKCSAVE